VALKQLQKLVEKCVGVKAEMHKRHGPLLFSNLCISCCSSPSLRGSVPVGSKRGGLGEAAKSAVDVFALVWRCGCDSNGGEMLNKYSTGSPRGAKGCRRRCNVRDIICVQCVAPSPSVPRSDSPIRSETRPSRFLVDYSGCSGGGEWETRTLGSSKRAVGKGDSNGGKTGVFGAPAASGGA
jgi:hypothetical protein